MSMHHHPKHEDHPRRDAAHFHAHFGSGAAVLPTGRWWTSPPPAATPKAKASPPTPSPRRCHEERMGVAL